MARLILFLALLCFGAGGGAAQTPVAFEKSALSIITATGNHAFTVEVARTRAQLSRGLMYRRSLALNAGMLFDFGEDQTVSMWMKNTYVSLDMLFIHGDGRIESIRHRTTPLSTRTITSKGPVRAVLELKGGVARLLGIKPGDRVVHPIFKPAGIRR